MNNGVEFKNISTRYGPDASSPLAVKGIRFEIKKGSLTTILGPSGCGKTTTLRMIAGLELPTSGQIMMGGKDVKTLGLADRNVSMMFQSYALSPHMNVVENVMHGLKMSGIAKDAARSRAGDALKNVGLVGFDQLCPVNWAGSSSAWHWRARWCWSLADRPAGSRPGRATGESGLFGPQLRVQR